MIRTLVYKEIQLKIFDKRFIISNIIVFILIIFSVIFLSENYLVEMDDYQTALKDENSSLQKVHVYSQLKPNLFISPNSLSIFDQGIADRINKKIAIRYDWIPRHGLEMISENPLTKIFQQFDLISVFKLVLSLLAILMVYDSFSGEKENGTLKLMLSNNIKRSHLLIAKLTSNVILLSIPVLLSFIFSLLIITTLNNISFSNEQWFRILLMIFFTIIYLTFFISLGLLISSITKNSNVSLILLTSLWILLCMIQPNLGSYIASTTISAPSVEELEQSYQNNWNEFKSQEKSINESIQHKIPSGYINGNYGVFDIDGMEYYVIWDGTASLLWMFLYKTIEIEPLRHEYAQKEWAIYNNNYLPRLEKQFHLQNIINCLSPVATYNSVCSSLSQTDAYHYDHFLNEARKYRSSYMNYLTNDLKIFSDNAHEYFTRLDKNEFENNHFEEREKNNTDHRESNTQALNLSGLPVFHHKPKNLINSIESVSFDIFLLIGYICVIMLLNIVKLQKLDVR